MRGNCITRVCILAAGICWGCAGAGGRGEREALLPFTVRLAAVELAEDLGDVNEEAAAVAAAAATSAVENLLDLKGELAKALDEAGIFTSVTAEEEGDPDLEMRITITGRDFGEGEPELLGATFSTLAWLFGGHLSWWIPNRAYPDSDVWMKLTIRRGGEPAADERGRRGGREPEVLFQDDLRLKGLTLSFRERASMTNWFLNILLPPWWGEGDPSVAGPSLARRSVEFFAAHEPDRLVSSFPAACLDKARSFLAHKPSADEVVIISQELIESLRIEGDGGASRLLPEEKLREVEEPEKETVRLGLVEHFADRVVGIGSDPNHRYYRVELEETDGSLVRIEAALRGQPQPARWTVRRGGEPGRPLVAVSP